MKTVIEARLALVRFGARRSAPRDDHDVVRSTPSALRQRSAWTEARS
jgi:hypothetical protein